jgi:DNA-binding transcriptional regulator GbsR (MarR family)
MTGAVPTDAVPTAAGRVAGDWRATFVERFGVVGDDMGLPRTMTRLLGWLVVCDPPYQSAQQIQAGLRLSSGSVSTGLGALARGGLVERLTFPGDRHIYYKVGPDGWRRLMAGRLRVLGEIRHIADQALTDSAGRADGRLREMRDFYASCERLFTELLDAAAPSDVDR